MSDSERDETTNVELVGYGRPPLATRFKKGQSGNPNGRPRGILNFTTTLRKAMRERVVINEHGKRKLVTKLEAAVKQLVNQAASGNQRAGRFLFELAQQIDKTEDQAMDTAAPFSEIDTEVIQELLNRFQSQEPGSESESEQQTEVEHQDDQRS
ncbi:MAG TPA: DUF5681 domain-containing protein [Candidatus Sulfotelmatobacter sp.]|jgi:hypothetical protein|nr:DUF5681 domain-containing protein [Candidatus Sulfotelmatobacter sp.]